MIINPARKFCFFHIPKTGGTTLNNVFSHMGDCEILDSWVSYSKISNGPIVSHATWDREDLKQIKRIELDPLVARPATQQKLDKHSAYQDFARFFTPESSADFNLAAVIRDPYSRAVSAYNWIADHIDSGQANAHFVQFYSSGGKMLEFEDAVCKGFAANMVEFRPQMRWIEGAGPRFTTLRISALAQDMGNWLAQMGYPDDKVQTALHLLGEKKNVSRKRLSVSDLSSRDRIIIEALYYSDFRNLKF